MAYYTTLTGTRLWITLAGVADGTAVVCGTQQSQAVDTPLDGEVRHYAGNRIQGVIRDQDDKSMPLTLRHLSTTDRDQLIAWRGQVVLVRTIESERFFAVYYNVPYRRMLGTTPDDGSTDGVTYDVDLVFQKVSWNEAV